MKTWPETKFSFKQQFVAIFSVGILSLALISVLITSTLSSRAVYEQLLSQGKQITLSFANRSKVALLYQSAETAKAATQAVMAFPGVITAGIYTSKRALLYQEGQADTEPMRLWPDSELAYRETPGSWHFVMPVFAGATAADSNDSPFVAHTVKPERVGYVHITITKKALVALRERILRTNLFISFTLSALLLGVLLFITGRLTRPLKNLADIMGRAEGGETRLRAASGGPKDILHMEHAFNTMMEQLEAREQALKRARDSALGMANAKTEFAAMVSHELRTPMNGVLGMIELIRRSGLTAKQNEYIKVARESGEALLLLIDDILDFSKIEVGKMKISPVNFTLRELVDDVVELLSFQAQSKRLDLHAKVEADVPDILHGDSGRIRQILINLLGNAIKFTAQGSVTLRVSSQHCGDRDMISFEVVDTGIGIPEDAQQRIFEAFSQVDSTATRRFSGAGLGLSISRQLAQLMGGNIEVVSEEGKGSHFTLLLPLIPALEMEPDVVDEGEQLAGLRVLIASDDRAYCRRLGEYFMTWGSFERHVGDGRSVREMLQQAILQRRPYDVVIIDQVMDMESGELARVIGSELGVMSTKLLIFNGIMPPGPLPHHPLTTMVLPRPKDRRTLYQALLNLLHTETAGERLSLPAMHGGEVAERAEHPLVLIAEDNRASQLVAQGMVERLGYRAEIVADGAAALEQLQALDVALVLMDCYMPVLDGFDATRRIRQLSGARGRVPVIAMTARAGAEDRLRCEAAGMDTVLVKPLSFDELERVLLQFLPLGPVTMPVQYEAEDTGFDVDRDAVALDVEKLEQLRLHAGATTLSKTLNAFLEDTPRYLERLDEAINSEDRTAVRDLAHCVFGSAMNVGALPLADRCRELETVAETASAADLQILQQQMLQQYRQIRQLLPSETPVGEEAHSQSTLIPRPSVLVVDDERSARIGIQGILERDGYLITEAVNGRQALELCRERMPDLILMDAMMPDMDGFKACQAILQLPADSHPPIVIITALHDESSIDKAFAAGATDYIPKPINLLVLRKRVERLLLAHRSERHIHRLAYFDNLTGLPNRTLFEERAEEMLENAARRGEMLALLFLDLDRFKLFNDTLGHDAGDLLLRTAAKRLQGCVRASDLVARRGGDEFTIMLEGIRSPEMVAKVADTICRAFNQPFTFAEQRIYLSCSVGIALFPNNGNDLGTLVKHADTAMYRAKTKGGACFQYYEFGMETEILRKVELEGELRHALEHNELELHYQPQVNVRSGELHGLEALVRWQHPRRGLLPPVEFIPLAEECGLINRIGEWVLSRVCAQQAEWVQRLGTAVPVSVNVACSQLGSGDLLHYVQSTLADTGISPTLLKLEFTETNLVASDDIVLEQMKAFKALGVKLEIDDFGIGYSSLSYLKHLPVDALKIDRSFIKDLPDEEENADIVAGIIALAHKLDLEVVAEGVETQAQLELLREQECDVVQGYLMSRPLPVPELEQWLSRYRAAHKSVR